MIRARGVENARLFQLEQVPRRGAPVRRVCGLADLEERAGVRVQGAAVVADDLRPDAQVAVHDVPQDPGRRTVLEHGAPGPQAVVQERNLLVVQDRHVWRDDAFRLTGRAGRVDYHERVRGVEARVGHLVRGARFVQERGEGDGAVVVERSDVVNVAVQVRLVGRGHEDDAGFLSTLGLPGEGCEDLLHFAQHGGTSTSDGQVRVDEQPLRFDLRETAHAA